MPRNSNCYQLVLLFIYIHIQLLTGLRFSSKTTFWPVKTLFMSKSWLINSIIFNRRGVILIFGCPNYSIGLMEVFLRRRKINFQMIRYPTQKAIIFFSRLSVSLKKISILISIFRRIHFIIKE